MGYIPEGAEWYLAEIVEQLTVEGDPRNVIHTNLVLVRADSPDEAYDKAVELGTAGETSYENPAGKAVNIRFRGLHELNVIYESLEHGSELSYTENLEMDEPAIGKWLSTREDLGVFRPISQATGPDYSSREVMEQIAETLCEKPE